MDRYFNRKKAKLMRSISVMGYVLYGIIVIPLIIIIIAGLQDGDTAAVVTTSIIGTILTAEVIILGKFSKDDMVRVGRYIPIIEEDHDGIITYNRLSEMTGYSLEKVKKDVARLVRGGYVSNVVYDDEKLTLLTNQSINVICPTCGASNTVMFGSSNKCKHCGSYLRRV